MTTIAENLRKIREYTRTNPPLRHAHHFCYDLRLNPQAAKVEYVVMGINPGETDGDRNLAPKVDDMPLEETSESDFHNGTGLTNAAQKMASAFQRDSAK